MYIEFLRTKLTYHRNHPAFSGTFDYEEYVSLMGVEDPNEGYETIFELMGLLDRVEAFQKEIFSNLRSYGNNEARIAALVPLVEESFGIYQFIVSMMAAMHTIIGSVEVLGPLRESFSSHHYRLARFYEECMNIRYLTSLIQVPKLSTEPPNFMASGPPKQPPRNEPKRNNADMERDRQRREQEVSVLYVALTAITRRARATAFVGAANGATEAFGTANGTTKITRARITEPKRDGTLTFTRNAATGNGKIETAATATRAIWASAATGVFATTDRSRSANHRRVRTQVCTIAATIGTNDGTSTSRKFYSD
jgi:hypothetical protein